MGHRNFVYEASRRGDQDSMYVSTDMKSLSKGRRIATRTEVCRPALVWDLKHGYQPDTSIQKLRGVVLDLNPYGMKIRTLDELAVESEWYIQLMRDDEFRIPLSQPIKIKVVRRVNDYTGFFDQGVQVQLTKIVRIFNARQDMVSRPNPRRYLAPKMHTADLTRSRWDRRRG